MWGHKWPGRNKNGPLTRANHTLQISHVQSFLFASAPTDIFTKDQHKHKHIYMTALWKNPCCFGLIKNFKWNNTHTFSSFNLPSLSLSLALSLLEEYPTLCLVPQKISHKQSQNKRKWLLMDKETHQEMPNAKRPHFFDVYSAIFSSQRLVFFFLIKKILFFYKNLFFLSLYMYLFSNFVLIS